ncbi:MAG TPA: DUF1836 domain-containing protein [Clostridiaceae bacterium]
MELKDEVTKEPFIFNEEDLLKLAKEISDLDELKLSSLPDIALYMDQITSFLDDKLKGFKRKEGDQILSKTMINNYTKDGILMPPFKKKYSREHMIELIMIYHLKQVLSINDIDKLFSPMVKKPLEDRELLSTYEIFSHLLVDESNLFYSEFENRLTSLTDESKPENKDSLLLTILLLSIRSGIEKRMAEKLIDTYYERKTGKV